VKLLQILRNGYDKFTQIFFKKDSVSFSSNYSQSDVIVENISDDYYEKILETKQDFDDIDMNLMLSFDSDIESNGWKLPGRENSHWWCGTWRANGCPNSKTHEKLGHGNKSYVQQFKKACFRSCCKKCHGRWATRQALAASQRIEIYRKHRGGKLQFLKLSLPIDYDYSDIKKARSHAIAVLKQKGVSGGSLIFCPFQLDHHTRTWKELPCFFVAYFGQSVKSSFEKGWNLSLIAATKSVESIFYSVLQMSGIKKGHSSFVWFGSMSYSKLKLKKPRKSAACCPACNAKLVSLIRQRNNFEPDAWKWGYFDPEEWALADPPTPLISSILSKFHTSRKLLNLIIPNIH
jgi:hypothetical protein